MITTVLSLKSSSWKDCEDINTSTLLFINRIYFAIFLIGFHLLLQKWRLYYPGFCLFVSHLYKDALFGSSKGNVHISQANILAQADGTRATGYRANFIIITIKNGVSLARNGSFIINSKAHKLAVKAFFLYFQKRITANKV